MDAALAMVEDKPVDRSSCTKCSRSVDIVLPPLVSSTHGTESLLLQALQRLRSRLWRPWCITASSVEYDQ